MKMISRTFDPAGMPSDKEVSLFLSRYSAWLLGSGATCIRLEKNVRRMAQVYGKEVELVILPRHIHVSVRGEGALQAETSIVSIRRTPISFRINTLLSELSWEVADGKMDFESAQVRLDEVVNNDGQSPWFVLIWVVLANAAFCRLFGGDAIAMLTVGVATLAGYSLKQWLLRRGVDIRVMALLCSFVSAVLGATDLLFSFGTTPQIALGTSVLYLVPGIPFLNSFSDMFYGHHLCAFSRFADALVLTCCLSTGLCVGMLLMHANMF